MISVVKVANKSEGQAKAHEILKTLIDSETLLALSGGTSPDYKEMLVESGDILPGAVCVVDERYGKPFHENSNELLIKKSGLIKYLQKKGIGFHKILTGKKIDQTVFSYQKVIEDLFEKYPKKVGIVGVGANMHTAGLFPDSKLERSLSYVVSDEVDDEFPIRITLTIRALAEFSAFIVMVFGEGKREALMKVLDEKENDMRTFPAIYYRKAPVKTYLITDLEI